MKGKSKSGKGWKFSARERRAVFFLLPLVVVLAWILWAASRPRFDDSATMLGDTLVGEHGTDLGAGVEVRRQTRKTDVPAPAGAPQAGETAVTLFDFDPNTATYEDFRRLGIPKSSAAGIVKYRDRGKVFQIPEDFATCYGITDSMYAVLKPYISIAARFRAKPADTRPEAGRTASGTERRSVNDGDSLADPSDSALPEMSATASGARPFASVDINTADSALLVQIRGIGAKSAQAIVAYREKLGGFHSIEQLAELPVVTERNYELMREQIWADSCEIQKIDINFASPNTVAGHPYMAGKKARRILRNRQMRGGWSTIEDMIQDNTLTPEEAARLAPYLHFTAIDHQ